MEHRGLLRSEVCPSGTVVGDEDDEANEKRTLVLSRCINSHSALSAFGAMISGMKWLEDILEAEHIFWWLLLAAGLAVVAYLTLP